MSEGKNELKRRPEPQGRKKQKPKKKLIPKNKSTRLEEFLKKPVKDLIDRCLLEGFRPNVLFLSRKINSIMNLPKTGLLGTRFVNVEFVAY